MKSIPRSDRRARRIVVLDGYTLNPGDLSWDRLQALGTCDIYERTPAAEVAPRIGTASIVLTNKAPPNRAVIEALPHLRYIGVSATGYNIVDVAAARERGILVTHVPAYGTASVAQLVFALLLELTHHVGSHAQSVREGRWQRCRDFSYWDFPLVELAGLTLGIVGYGQIGRAVARIGQAFDLRILAASRTRRPDEPNIQFTDLTTLFRESDVVTLHCPLSPDTQGLVNAERLAQMKPSAFLINTGRGGLVVEADLAQALEAGRIAGAGLDVLSTEPPTPDNPLPRARNCLITPHFAWATLAARRRLMSVAMENLECFLAGNPRNVV